MWSRTLLKYPQKKPVRPAAEIFSLVVLCRVLLLKVPGDEISSYETLLLISIAQRDAVTGPDAFEISLWLAPWETLLLMYSILRKDTTRVPGADISLKGAFGCVWC